MDVAVASCQEKSKHTQMERAIRDQPEILPMDASERAVAGYLENICE